VLDYGYHAARFRHESPIDTALAIHAGAARREKRQINAVLLTPLVPAYKLQAVNRWT
jgi:hypothetical protein